MGSVIEPRIVGNSGRYDLRQYCSFDTRSGGVLKISYRDCPEIVATILDAAGMEASAVAEEVAEKFGVEYDG